MKNEKTKRFLFSLLCIVLITAVALSAIGCESKTKKADDTSLESDTSANVEVVGEGDNQFTFIVRDSDKSQKVFDVHTNEKTVGKALKKLQVIGGDNSTGLYTEAAGIVADYNKDGTYWAYYVEGQYASESIDDTEIENGKTYTFAREK